MEEALVSVIVPVYNVEKYIERCILSVLNQTYQNYELLLVDDGSADASGRICDAYHSRYRQIKVYHKENGGLSDARNYGLQKAKGEYIVFLDSDDYIAKEFLACLYGLLEEAQADIAVCGFYHMDTDTFPEEKKDRTYQTVLLSAQETLADWHGIRGKMETCVWNKLYKRKVFSLDKEPVLFPVGTYYEDVYTTHRLVANAERIVFTEKPLYMYYKRSGSIMESKLTIEKMKMSIMAQKKRLDFFESRGYERSADRLLAGLALHEILFYSHCKDSEGEEGQLRERVWRQYQEQYKRIQGIKGKGMIKSLLFFSFHCFPRATAWMVRNVYPR